MSKQLSTARIFTYQFATIGIYFFVWCNRLGKELNSALRQKAVPSMWWFALPGGSYYWMWRMAESLDTATGKRIRMLDTFLLYVLITAGMGGSSSLWFPDFSTHDTSEQAGLPPYFWQILIAVIVIVVIASLALHAVFMSIIQNKLNKIRGNAS